jgi:hypothetical protein
VSLPLRSGSKRLCLTENRKTGGDVLALVAETIILARGTNTRAGQAFGVVFFFIHLVFFATFLDATSFTYATEIWPNHLRAKGLSIAMTAFYSGSSILVGASPTAFKNVNKAIPSVTPLC